jgi:hypothetical protein
MWPIQFRRTLAAKDDPGDSRYRDPLIQDAHALARLLPVGSKIVLFGSIARRGEAI